MTRKRLILEEGASRTHETCSKGAGAAIPARATLLHPQRIIMVSLCRYLQYRKASAGQLNERLEATLTPREYGCSNDGTKLPWWPGGPWWDGRPSGTRVLRGFGGGLLLEAYSWGFAGVTRNPT
jgi:hypothetical protein